LAVFRSARQDLGEILSAFELIDGESVKTMQKAFSDFKWPLSNPISSIQPDSFFVLIETMGSNGTHDSEKVDSFLTRAMSDGIVSDGTLSDSISSATSLWLIREKVPVALPMLHGHVFKYDLSIPLPDFYTLVTVMREKLNKQFPSSILAVVGFGHLGDQNLHLNVVAKSADPAIQDALEPCVYEWAAEHHGSISAEHGIGMMKKKYLRLSKSREAIQIMRKMKTMFDMNHILNPDKIFDNSLPDDESAFAQYELPAGVEWTTIEDRKQF